MTVFEFSGLIIMAIVMIPNILCGIYAKESFQNYYQRRSILSLEQIGRYGCFILMAFTPLFAYGDFWYSYFWFSNAKIVYLIVNGVLLLIYLFGYLLLWNKKSAFKAYLLSIIPSLMFLFSGIIVLDYLFIGLSLLFGYCHITISVFNSKYI